MPDGVRLPGIRFTNDQVLNTIEKVLTEIDQVLDERS
jgi:very-short-patch-repair endonuclease